MDEITNMARSVFGQGITDEAIVHLRLRAQEDSVALNYRRVIMPTRPKLSFKAKLLNGG